MDNSVALVQAYLRATGYFTVTEYPVVALRGDALKTSTEHSDLLIGEVKEGRAELNDAASDPAVLRAVLAGFWCCPREDAPRIVAALIRDDHALLPTGHRIGPAIFASIVSGVGHSHQLVISLGHIVQFLRAYIDEHWEIFARRTRKILRWVF